MKQKCMRRVLVLVLVLCLLPLSACGNEPNETVVVTSTTTTQATSASTTDTTVTTESTTAITTIPTTTTTASSTTATTITTTTTTTTTAQTTTTTAAPKKEWELYWSDEFYGNALDMSKWNIEGGSNGLVTKEADNVKVEDGNCVITVRRDDSTPGFSYSSAYVTTAYKFSFCYGRLEFRAKLPYGQGVWPALWTLGDYYLTTTDELGWPRGGEIDVMELVGSSSSMRPNQKIMGTLHWGPDRNHHEQAHGWTYLSEPASWDYHVYAVEWDEKEMVWFVDDMEYLRVSLDDPDMGDAFATNHWIIMNINLYNYGEEGVDETTELPQSMYVDYVRVYKEK